MKSAMSGQQIPLVSRLESAWKLFRAFRTGVFGDACSEISFHHELADIIKIKAGIDVKKARILDLGCGQLATQTLLFKIDGADITGIDMEVPSLRMNLKTFIKIIWVNSLERAVKSLFRHLFFDFRFFSKLSTLYRTSLPIDQLDLRLMDATNLSFPDDHFDFIFSSCVFEHINDVPAAIREVNRVLKPEGRAWISVHLFPSLSGGHHLDWKDPDTHPLSTKVPPWDHLLENKHPANTYMNRLRLKQYREIFATNIIILEEKLIHQGEKILTPEIEMLLQNKNYTREDLVTCLSIFLCSKKAIWRNCE